MLNKIQKINFISFFNNKRFSSQSLAFVQKAVEDNIVNSSKTMKFNKIEIKQAETNIMTQDLGINSNTYNNTNIYSNFKMPSDNKIKPKYIISFLLKNNIIRESEMEIAEKKLNYALKFLKIKSDSEYVSNEAHIMHILNLFELKPYSDIKNLEDRPPLVTILGHVDHGKTTLLDSYRNTRVSESEAGGITQNIGGFTLSTSFGKISFIDTPGHELFTNMRQRGAHITDIAVLVISAIEGIQKQTIEVLELLQSKKIPFIIAINKVDVEFADPLLVEEDLVERGVEIEPYGGDIPVLHISAKTKLNTELLLELLIYEGHKLGLKFDPESHPVIYPLESRNMNYKDKKSCTIVVKNGKLEIGNYLIINNTVEKCLQIKNDRGSFLKEAKCGEIIELFGIKTMPMPGESIKIYKNEQDAKEYVKMMDYITKSIENEQKIENFKTEEESNDKITLKFKSKRDKRKFYSGKKEVIIDTYQEKINMLQNNLELILSNNDDSIEAQLEKEKCENEIKNIELLISMFQNKVNKCNIMFKLRDYGIREVLESFLADNNITDILNIIKIDIGPINENDIFLAKESNSKILTMDVVNTMDIKKQLKNNNIEIFEHNIIYNLFQDLNIIADKFRTEIDKNKPIGNIKINKIFKIKLGKEKVNTAGCTVITGKVISDGVCELVRDGKLIKDKLRINNLKKFKDDIKEAEAGEEIGLSFIGYDDIKEGDIINCFNN